MKYFLSLILLFSMVLAPQAVSSQKYGDIQTDTANASENLIRYIGGTSATDCEYFPYAHDFSMAIKGDSLSGATNTNVILEGGYKDDPSIWAPIDTANINGVASVYYTFHVNAANAALRYRYRVQAPSGTQATRVDGDWMARKRQNY